MRLLAPRPDVVLDLGGPPHRGQLPSQPDGQGQDEGGLASAVGAQDHVEVGAGLEGNLGVLRKSGFFERSTEWLDCLLLTCMKSLSSTLTMAPGVDTDAREGIVDKF